MSGSAGKLGDCAWIPSGDGKAYPQLAQHALREARVLAREISYLVKQIRSHIGKTRPAFLSVFIVNWFNSMQGLHRLLKKLGPEYVDVTPSQLNTLYREAHPGAP